MAFKRPLITIQLTVQAAIALFAALSPRFTYWSECQIYRRVTPVYCDLGLDRFDLAMTGLATCFLLFLVYRCHRAAGVLADLDRPADEGLPGPLLLALASVAAAPLWLTPLAAAYGKWAVMAAAVWWMVATLSTLCYVGALCAYDAERGGEAPGTTLLSAGYNLGGAPGVYLAHRLLPGSRTLAEMLKIPPAAAVFMAGVVVVTVLIRMT